MPSDEVNLSSPVARPDVNVAIAAFPWLSKIISKEHEINQDPAVSGDQRSGVESPGTMVKSFYE